MYSPKEPAGFSNEPAEVFLSSIPEFIILHRDFEEVVNVLLFQVLESAMGEATTLSTPQDQVSHLQLKNK